MNFGQFVYETLTDMKEGIDLFNKESKDLKARYPNSIRIEHSGISITCQLKNWGEEA